MKITCSKCKKSKVEKSFAIRNKEKSTRMSYCRSCQNIMSRAHYHKNKEYYITKNKRRFKKLSVAFLEWLMTQKCLDCGNTDIRVLEFHHKHDKLFNIGTKRAYTNLSSLKPEIDKCDILCANCHRIRTAEEFGYYKSMSSNKKRPAPSKDVI